MRWLVNTRIGSRLSAGSGGVIALLLLLAGVDVSRIDAVLSNAELILHDRYANIALGHSIENDLNRQATCRTWRC